MWTTSGPTHSLECLTWSLHTQHHWLCLLLRSRKCLVVPAEKKAQAPAPWPPFGQYKPRTRLASCWALESLRTHWVPREKKKHSTWEVLHSSVSKAQKKKKNISCPRHPHWTASFPPPPSLQQTNIVKDKHRCCSPVLITRFFKTRNKGFHMCLSLKESLRAFSSRNINEQIDFFHIQYTVVPTAADQPCKVQVLQSSCSILTAQCLIQPIATHQMLHFRSTHIFW